MPRVPVEPIRVEDVHVFACFDALLAHLNGHAPPAVSFADATWCAQTWAARAGSAADSLCPHSHSSSAPSS